MELPFLSLGETVKIRLQFTRRIVPAMWFKQLQLFRLDLGNLPDFDTLDTALAAKPFAPPSGLDWFTQGFVPAAPHQPDLMLFRQQHCALVALRREDKVLPASVVRDLVEEKIADIEARDFRKVGKKERQGLKEQVTDDLLPRAFTRRSRTAAYLDCKNGWLGIESSTPAKAEALISALREALPPFPARLPHTALSPSSQMTVWLLGGVPDGFELDADCELKAPEEHGAVVRCTRQDLTAAEIRVHLESGKQVTKLGLIWRERIRFVLTDTLQIKRLQFLDLLQEEASQAGDDLPALFEASFSLMTGELAWLTADLMAALGGEIDAPFAFGAES